jgi:hypothetical protein
MMHSRPGEHGPFGQRNAAFLMKVTVPLAADLAAAIVLISARCPSRPLGNLQPPLRLTNNSNFTCSLTE